MSIAGDLLEGTLLYDARGEAYVQPLLSGGKVYRLPPRHGDEIRQFPTALKMMGWIGVVPAGLLLPPWQAACAAALLLAFHPVGVRLLTLELQPVDPAELGTRAERLLRLAQHRGERQILGRLSKAAFLITLSLVLFGWAGSAWLGLVAAVYGAVLAIQNVGLLRALRSAVQMQTRVP